MQRAILVVPAPLLGPALITAVTLVTQLDLIFGQMLIGMDTATAFYPWYTFLGEQLRAGHIPVWNPHQFSGTPFAADPESGWMYLPAMLAFTLLPLEAGARSFILFHAALAGLSVYAFARALGLSNGGSVLAAIAYADSGFFAGHNVCCWAYASVAAWLPLMLLGAERAICATNWDSRGLWWGVAGLALSQILAAWIGQAAYYALLVLGSYIAYRTLLATPLGPPRGNVLKSDRTSNGTKCSVPQVSGPMRGACHPKLAKDPYSSGRDKGSFVPQDDNDFSKGENVFAHRVCGW